MGDLAPYDAASVALEGVSRALEDADGLLEELAVLRLAPDARDDLRPVYRRLRETAAQARGALRLLGDAHPEAATQAELALAQAEERAASAFNALARAAGEEAEAAGRDAVRATLIARAHLLRVWPRLGCSGLATQNGVRPEPTREEAPFTLGLGERGQLTLNGAPVAYTEGAAAKALRWKERMSSRETRLVVDLARRSTGERIRLGLFPAEVVSRARKALEPAGLAIVGAADDLRLSARCALSPELRASLDGAREAKN